MKKQHTRAPRRQRPLRGGRRDVRSYLTPALKDAVARDAARFGVSCSFVIAVAVAEQLGHELPLLTDQRDSRAVNRQLTIVERKRA